MTLASVLLRGSLFIGTDTIRHRNHAKRGDQNGQMSTAHL
jgi:hypothetical protein